MKYPTLGLILAACLQTAMAQNAAGVGGSSAKATSGDGFGCAAGTTYQMANGLARCTLPNATGSPGASCPASPLTQSGCTFNFPSTTSGSTPSISTSTPGHTGVAEATCSHGAWGGLSATCSANPCSGTVGTYGSCSFTIPGLASGQSTVVSTTTSGFNGSETASCTSGSLFVSGQSCAPIPLNPCAGGTLTWGAGCSAAVASTPSGAGTSMTNVVAGYTGSATFGCTNGTWSSSAATCTANPTGCAAGAIHWGAGCTAPVTASPSDSNESLTNVASGYTGNATVACSSGTWSLSTGSCSPNAVVPPGPPLVACPANIWVTSGNVQVPLSVSTPLNTLPNGHAYCMYSKISGDRYAGAFDRVTGQAVDFFPVFKEIPDYTTYDTNNSTFVFSRYEPRYSNNLHIQGSYCSNNLSDPIEKGYYPGTCMNNGNGKFAPMCFIDMDPSTTLGGFMAGAGIGLRMQDGGSTHWKANVYAPYTVDDGTNTWSAGDLWSAAYGFYNGGGANRCVISNAANEKPVPELDNPIPQGN